MNKLNLILIMYVLTADVFAEAQEHSSPSLPPAAATSTRPPGPMRDPIRFPLERFRSLPEKFEWAWRRVTEHGPQPLGDVVRRNQKGCVKYDESSTEVCTFGMPGDFGATAYCRSIGERLATIHEIALALNPEGVSDIPKEGFRPIYQRNGKIWFYYNAATYSPEKVAGLPTSGGMTLEELKSYKIWTSSVPNYTGGAFYAFASNWPEQIFLQEHGYARYDEAVIRCTRTKSP